MPSSSMPPEESFAEAAQSWNLDQLYLDLASAKTEPLSSTEKTCLRGLLCNKDPRVIAKAIHRGLNGLRVDLSRGLYRYVSIIANEPVRNWRDVADFLYQQGYQKSSSPVRLEDSYPNPDISPGPKTDTDDAPDLSMFFGRTQELQQLEEWLIQDRCRTVAILGMGGIGKTDLSVKVTRAVQEQFQFVIWRSLLNAPPVLKLLTDLIQFLSNQQESNPPENLEAGLKSILRYLKDNRCLIILDNFETLLQEADVKGAYNPEYEEYGQLLKKLGTVSHQSCVLLTSREKPKEIARLEGTKPWVKCLELQGLDIESSKAIFTTTGDFYGSEQEWQTLIEFYNGNPLALELIAKHIQATFDGDITAFLQDGTSLTFVLEDLLTWHFERLTDAEQEIMQWMAIAREAVTIAELRDDLLSSTAKVDASATLESLQRRFPLERRENRFTLQPAVMEYVTRRVAKQLCQEIITLNIHNFNRYAIVKAQAKDYVRESQIRILVDSILAELQDYFHNRTAIIEQLQKLLQHLKEHFTNLRGYAGGNLINLLRHFNVDLTDYDFSHLSVWQADLTDIKLYNVNLLGTDLKKTVFAETFGGVLCVTFSPDGKWLATSDTCGDVHVWDVMKGKQQFAVKSDSTWTFTVAFNPDAKILASAGDDHQIQLWDAKTGRHLRVLQGHSKTINTVAFNPVNGTLASAGQDATIRLWSLNEGDCIGILQGHQGTIWAIAFSPDGQTLISASEDCTLKQWDIQTSKCLQTWSHSQWVRCVAFSPDGQWVASGSFDGMINLWEVDSGECLASWQAHQNCVTAVMFCPRSSSEEQKFLFVSGSYDQTIKLWDTPTGTCLKAWQAHTNQIWSVAFSPNCSQIASGGYDHAARLWNIRTGQPTKTWKGHTNGILSLAHNPNRTLLATGHEDEAIRLWDVGTGQIQQTLRGHQGRVWSVTFAPPSINSSPDPILASGSADRTIKLWNSSTGECQNTLQGHQNWVWSIDFDPSGRWLASGSYDQTIRLWSVQTGECLHVLLGHTAPVVCVAFSPDGQYLASSSFDTTIKLWNLSSGKCFKTLKGHQHNVWAIAFHPEGHQLASCSYDRTIKLWSLPQGKCLHTLGGHTAPVACLAFGHNGQQLVSGGYDHTIRLWDLNTKQLLRTFDGHTKPVYSILFDKFSQFNNKLSTKQQNRYGSATPPDQEWIISSSFDETLRFWDIRSGSYLESWRVSRPYEGMNIKDATGLTEAQKVTLYALGALER